MANDKTGDRPVKGKSTLKRSGHKTGQSEKKQKRPLRIMAPAESAAARLRRGNGFFESGVALVEEFILPSPVDGWRENAASVCAETARGKVFSGKKTEDLIEVARQSRSCSALLDHPALAQLAVRFDSQTALSGLCITKNGEAEILLNPARPAAEIIMTFFRELRRAWQHASGLLQNPLRYDPEDAVLLNRVQNADATAMALRMAWEINLAGCTNAWDTLMSSEYYALTRAFSNQARGDFRSLNSGAACRAAYDSWFESDMTKSYDRRVIHEMLLDEEGYVFGVAREDRFLSNDLLVRFGEMPLGGNYFLADNARLPDDPAYAVVEDRSNANFLWFVKFERSFLDKEREMAENAAEILPFRPKPAVESAKGPVLQTGETGRGNVFWLVPKAVESSSPGSF